MRTIEDYPVGTNVVSAEYQVDKGVIIAHSFMYPNAVVVEWQSGIIGRTEVQFIKFASEVVPDEVTELEMEFKAIVNSNKNVLELFVTQAERALEQALDLSEKHGIPFVFNYKTFVPETFEDKNYVSLGNDKLLEILEIDYLDRCETGWNSSTWCQGG